MHFIAPNGLVENVDKCCAAVLNDESVHEIYGHLASASRSQRRTHAPCPISWGYEARRRPLACCSVGLGLTASDHSFYLCLDLHGMMMTTARITMVLMNNELEGHVVPSIHPSTLHEMRGWGAHTKPMIQRPLPSVWDMARHPLQLMLYIQRWMYAEHLHPPYPTSGGDCLSWIG